MIGFFRHLNTSTPFSLNEYTALWKEPRYMPWNFTEYRDFNVRLTLRDPEWLSVNNTHRSSTSAIRPVSFPSFGRMMDRW